VAGADGGSNPAIRAAHAVFVVFLFVSLPALSLHSRPQEVVSPVAIRVETVLVNVPVMVTDALGKYITGLNKHDFSLFQDGVPEPISIFAASEEPVSVALLLDTSKSTVTVLDKIKRAARRFLGRLRPRDRALVMTFDNEVRVLSPLSDDVKELSAVVWDVKPGEYVGTRLRDAVLEVTTARFTAVAGRKAIVLLSDGQDYGSEVSEQALLDSIAGSGTLVYSVFYSVDLRALSKELFGVALPRSAGTEPDSVWRQRELRAAAFLQQVSELSAGRFMRSEIRNLNETFGRIVEELRYQYLLGFYPERTKLDGAVHGLRVQVNRTDLAVRSRPNYRILKSQ
jgi:Ca-activated chloride channel homolog